MYLSLDLDYWALSRQEYNRDYSVNIINLISRLPQDIPCTFVLEHHTLLKFIPEGITHLVNVDAHSDISEIRYTGLKTQRDWKNKYANCGNWVNFVPGCENMHYTWRHTRHTCEDSCFGYCHGTVDPFEDNTCTGYKSVNKVRGLRGLDCARVKAVGIAYSRGYTRFNNMKRFLTALGIAPEHVGKSLREDSVFFHMKLDAVMRMLAP